MTPVLRLFESRRVTIRAEHVVVATLTDAFPADATPRAASYRHHGLSTEQKDRIDLRKRTCASIPLSQRAEEPSHGNLVQSAPIQDTAVRERLQQDFFSGRKCMTSTSLAHRRESLLR